MMRAAFPGIILACAALTMSAPASAQFEVLLPDTPPREGQTLLEWADPPILKHTIAEDKRGDTSSCGATSEYDLDQTAVACWPVLRAAQLFLLADYAAQERTGNKQENLRQGIAYAEEAIAFIGQPQWPLQEYLLIKSYDVKLRALTRLEEWNASYDASIQLVSAIQGDLFQNDEFRLAFAYRKQGQVFLKLDLYDGAKFVLADARKLLEGFDGDNIAMPFSDHSEDMIVAAIDRSELGYAQEMATTYLDHISSAPRGMRFGYESHIDLALYLAAVRTDRQAALGLLADRFADQRDYARCRKGMFEFPRVLGTLVEDPSIAKALIDGGCTKDQLSTRPTEPITGLGDKSLPPLQK